MRRGQIQRSTGLVYLCPKPGMYDIQFMTTRNDHRHAVSRAPVIQRHHDIDLATPKLAVVVTELRKHSTLEIHIRWFGAGEDRLQQGGCNSAAGKRKRLRRRQSTNRSAASRCKYPRHSLPSTPVRNSPEAN